VELGDQGPDLGNSLRLNLADVHMDVLTLVFFIPFYAVHAHIFSSTYGIFHNQNGIHVIIELILKCVHPKRSLSVGIMNHS
jgi:hypothetical protein